MGAWRRRCSGLAGLFALVFVFILYIAKVLWDREFIIVMVFPALVGLFWAWSSVVK